MLLIDFDKTPSQSFSRGFIKGLGAPYILFGQFQASPAPKINTVVPSCSPRSGAAIAGDWAKIGIDIRAALKVYGEESRAEK